MNFEERIDTFNDRIESSLSYNPSSDEVLEVCSSVVELKRNLSARVCATTVRCIAYFCYDDSLPETTRSKCLQSITLVIDPEVLTLLIEDLRSMLMQIKNNKVSNGGRLRNSDAFALNPSKGFSFEEDKVRNDWQENGGLRSIPLFHVVLSHIKHRDISSNLWWITPGILNLIDDTSDIEKIKLQGVLLLRRFLVETLDLSDDAHFNFANTGLFTIYHNTLTSMWYHFPPSTERALTAKIWDAIFSTIIPLIKAQFYKDSDAYKLHVSSFLSEILLQTTLPRIANEYTELTLQVLQYVDEAVQILGEKSVPHMQRMIYVLGEQLVRNPFITLFMPLVHQVLSSLIQLIEVCPSTRVVAHKYDFLACALTLGEKCANEGELNEKTKLKLMEYLKLLSANGCTWTSEERQMLENASLKFIPELP